jgi:hypothetical protein
MLPGERLAYSLKPPDARRVGGVSQRYRLEVATMLIPGISPEAATNADKRLCAADGVHSLSFVCLRDAHHGRSHRARNFECAKQIRLMPLARFSDREYLSSAETRLSPQPADTAFWKRVLPASIEQIPDQHPPPEAETFAVCDPPAQLSIESRSGLRRL